MASTIKVNEIQNLAGNTALTIDGNGVVNQPMTPHMSMYLSGGNTWNDYGNNAVIKDYIVNFSQGISINNSTGEFSVSQEGLYYISFSAYISGSSTTRRLAIILNGPGGTGYWMAQGQAGGTDEVVNLNTIIQLTPSDKIVIRQEYTGTQIFRANDHTNGFIYKIS